MTNQEIIDRWKNEDAPLLPGLHALHIRDGWLSDSRLFDSLPTRSGLHIPMRIGALSGVTLIGSILLAVWCVRSGGDGVHVIGAPSVEIRELAPLTGPHVSFLAVGDAGTGDRHQRQVALGMTSVASSTDAQFVIGLGDNFYEKGVASDRDPLFQKCFEEPYRELRLPFYLILGNHDHRGNIDAQLSYHSERWHMPGRHYSLRRELSNGTTLELFAIDTTPIVTRQSAGTAELSWLQEALRGSQADWKIVLGHHPFRSSGEHGDNAILQERLLPLLSQTGVDLYMSGHDHHAALHAPSQGVFQMICGSGSKHSAAAWSPDAEFVSTAYGFAEVEVYADRIRIRFFDQDGQALWASEHFHSDHRNQSEARRPLPQDTVALPRSA